MRSMLPKYLGRWPAYLLTSDAFVWTVPRAPRTHEARSGSSRVAPSRARYVLRRRRLRVWAHENGVSDLDYLVHRKVRPHCVLADRFLARRLIDADGAD
jgi:hypothetical protein